MSKQLESFFSQIVPEWNSLDPKERDEIVNSYASDPAKVDALLRDLIPNYLDILEQPVSKENVDVLFKTPQIREYARKVAKANKQPVGQATKAFSEMLGVDEGLGATLTKIPSQTALNTASSLTRGLQLLGLPEPYQAMKTWTEYDAPVVQGMNRQILGAATSVGQNLGAVGAALGGAAVAGTNPWATVAVGAPAILSAIKGSDVAGENYEQGGSFVGSALKGGLGAGTEFLGEYTGMYLGGFTKGMPNIAAMMATEIPSEIATEIADIGLDYVFQSGDLETPVGRRIGEVAVQTAIATPFIGGGLKLMQPAFQKIADIQETKQVESEKISAEKFDLMLREAEETGQTVKEEDIPEGFIVINPESRIDLRDVAQKVKEKTEDTGDIETGMIKTTDLKNTRVNSEKAQRKEVVFDDEFHNEPPSATPESDMEFRKTPKRMRVEDIEARRNPNTIEEVDEGKRWWRVGRDNEYSEFTFPLMPGSAARMTSGRGTGVATGMYAFGDKVAATGNRSVIEGSSGVTPVKPPVRPLTVTRESQPNRLFRLAKNLMGLADQATRKLTGFTESREYQVQDVLEQIPFGPVPALANMTVDEQTKLIEETVKTWQRHRMVHPLNILLRKLGYDGIEYTSEASWAANDGEFGNVKFPPIDNEGRPVNMRPISGRAMEIIPEEDTGDTEFEAAAFPDLEKPQIDQPETTQPEEFDTSYNPQPGDTVAVRVKYGRKGVPESSAENMAFGKLLNINENGSYVVEFEDGKTIPVSPKDIMEPSETGIAGRFGMPSDGAPTPSKLIRVSREILEAASGFFNALVTKSKKKSLAAVVFDKITGNPKYIRMDWMINRYPGMAQKVIAHEIGHILSLMAGTTVIPGMDTMRVNNNSLFGKLARQYFSSQNFILKQDPARDSAYAKALKEQQKYVDFLEQHYPKDNKFKRMIQDNWDKLMEDAGLRGFDQQFTRRANIYARKEARKHARAAGLTGQARKDFIQQAAKGFYKQYLVQAYEEKGAWYLPQIQEEMEMVTQAMYNAQFYKPADFSAIFKNGYDSHTPEELYANFFSAKINGLEIEVEGQKINMTDFLAPKASELFDAYLASNPVAKEIFDRSFEVYDSDDQKLEDRLTRIKKADEEKFARMEKADDSVIRRIWSSPGAFGTWAKRFIGGQFISKFYPVLDIIDKAKGRNAYNESREKIEQWQNLSAIAQSLVTQMEGYIDPMVDFMKKKGFEPDRALRIMGDYAMLKRIAAGETQKSIPYQVYNNDTGKMETMVANVPLFKGTYDIDQKTAKEQLRASIYKDIGPQLDDFMNKFEDAWQKHIVEPVIKSGLVTDSLADAMRKNKNYVYYAVVQSIKDHGEMYKRAPRPLKEMWGTLRDTTNPITSTIEHGLNLLFMAHTNDVKRNIVRKLPEEFKRKAKRIGGNWENPNSQNEDTLVIFRDQGKEEAWVVPSVMVDGIEIGLKTQTSEFLKLLSSKSEYFRDLYTTFQPAFQTANLLRDGFNLLVNAFNPMKTREILRPTYKMFRSYVSVLSEVLSRNPQTAKALEKEIIDLWQEGIPMSTYSYQSRYAGEDGGVIEPYQRILSSFQRDKKPIKASREIRAIPLIGNLLADYIIEGTPGKAWHAATSKVKSIGRQIEYLPKRAAARYYKPFLQQGVLTKAEYNMLVRESGSPNFLNKGSLTPLINSVYMFFNPGMQALYRDYNLALKSGGVMTKRMLAASMNMGFWSAMTQYVYSMLLGDDWRDFWDRVPKHDKDRGFIIPIGISRRGKSAYFVIPHDEQTAIFKRATRELLESRNATLGQTIFNLVKATTTPIRDRFDMSLQPQFQIIADLLTAANGEIPRDTLSNKPIMTESEFEDKGYAAWALIKHFLNAIAPWSVFYKFKTTRTDGKDIPPNPDAEISELIADMLETGINIPFLQTLIKAGMIRVSNQGLTDRSEVAKAQLDAVAGPVRATLQRALRSTPDDFKGNLTKVIESINRVGPKTPSEWTAITNVLGSIDEKYRDVILRNTIDPDMYQLISSDRATKLKLLEMKGVLK